MGRRKERRIAAISAAGRRVKLDLFAEPSGNLGGSSAQDEVGEDGDSRTRAELPDSPTTSGQKLHNPLLLLEQYSDEEPDECLSEGRDDTVAEDPSGDLDDKTKVVAGIKTENIGNDDVIDPSFQREHLKMDKDSGSQDPLQKLGKEGMSFKDTDDLLRETKPMEEGGSCPATADEQVVGDVSLIWKRVLHDESNQYYYWNIVTGETSWEVPDVFARATIVNCAEKAVGEDATTGKLNGLFDSNYRTISDSNRGGEAVAIDEGCSGDSLDNEGANADSSIIRKTSVNDNALVINGRHSGEYKSEVDLSSQLVKHCETLLERLNSLKSFNCNLLSQEFKLKSTLEVEIRLSDIKALASHGSVMFPFWLHTEDQLKRLDAAIDDAIQHSRSVPASDCEVTKSQANNKIVSNAKEAACSAMEFPNPEAASEKSNVEGYCDVATTTELVPSVVYHTMSSNDDPEGNNETNGLEMQGELSSKPVYHSGEEVDMDVDMEVELTTSPKSPSVNVAGVQYHVPSEQLNLHNPPADQEQSSLLGQIVSVQPPVGSLIPPPSLDNEHCPPLPPDNEPYPPPPPDDYPFPPPPPDEPPEESHSLPSHLESHSFPDPQQYVLSYPSSNFEYYGQLNTEISGTSLYVDPEGVQVTPSHIPPYYEGVSNIYSVSPLVVNPGDISTYYGLQNGNLNPMSLVGGAAVESSGIPSETIVKNREMDTIHSFDSHAEAVSDLLPTVNLNVVKPVQGLEKESEVYDSEPSIKAQSTASATHCVTASSISDASTSVSAAATTSKVQSKVSRSKKHTVSVISSSRSNKKVSSLVDKWKAAKEELREDEETENSIEMLERKRQRGIEDWQAQQIASGEAKDNANFQPLGGDWRERVKRKRALKMTQTENKSSEPTGHEEPNLVELSRDLRSGWQAYWDDSSKQVYYGNVLTSETTWIRPKD